MPSILLLTDSISTRLGARFVGHGRQRDANSATAADKLSATHTNFHPAGARHPGRPQLKRWRESCTAYPRAAQVVSSSFDSHEVAGMNRRSAGRRDRRPTARRRARRDAPGRPRDMLFAQYETEVIPSPTKSGICRRATRGENLARRRGGAGDARHEVERKITPQADARGDHAALIRCSVYTPGAALQSLSRPCAGGLCQDTNCRPPTSCSVELSPARPSTPLPKRLQVHADALQKFQTLRSG